MKYTFNMPAALTGSNPIRVAPKPVKKTAPAPVEEMVKEEVPVSAPVEEVEEKEVPAEKIPVVAVHDTPEVQDVEQTDAPKKATPKKRKAKK